MTISSAVKFSLILNSRERPILLKNLLKSIKQTTKNIDEIEVLIACDNDDTISRIVSYDLKNDYSFCQFYFRERTKNLNASLNELYNKSSGNYIFVLNDDVEFLTPDWDTLAYQALQEYTGAKLDGIVYGKIRDNSSDKVNDLYSPFPIISRPAADALGYVVSPLWISWGADLHIGRIFGKEGIDRICDLSYIKVSHVLHTDGKQGDFLRPEMMHNFLSSRQDYMCCDISEDVNKLFLAIKERDK